MKYTPGRKIGEGHHSTVFECTEDSRLVVKITKTRQEWETEKSVLEFFGEHAPDISLFPRLRFASDADSRFITVMDRMLGKDGKVFLEQAEKNEKREFGMALLRESLSLDHSLHPLSLKWKNAMGTVTTSLFERMLDYKWRLIREKSKKETLGELEIIVDALKRLVPDEPEIFIHNDLNF